jgi:hypothetical protein
MKKFFALITGAILAVAIASSPAFARNEVVNKWFQEGGEINPIQGGTGVAKWKVTRPDNGATMYFEQCWVESKGLACKYEVVLGDNAQGDNSHHDDAANNDSSQGANPNAPDAQHVNGEFESAKKRGGKWTAYVTINGVKTDYGPYTSCIEHNGKWWCY